MQLVDLQTGQVLLSRVEVASTIWQRFLGLMFRRHFQHGYGLLMERCRSIHTLWMRVPIDVYFLAADGTILDRRPQVRPWTLVIFNSDAHSVLEIPDAQITLAVGTRVRLEDELH